MKKPQWYKNLDHQWQECIDQLLHFIAGFCLGYFSPMMSVAVAIGREAWQNWGDTNNDTEDMLTDLTVWWIGAMTASLVF